MASTKEYRDYVLELLEELEGEKKVRQMMGEYLLYYEGILFGGIYDNRFLVKKVETNEKYKMKEELPYEGAKNMYLVEKENKDEIKQILQDTIKGLKAKNKK